MAGIIARLQTGAQSHELLPLGIELDGLMQTNVRYPDVALCVDCEAMGHQELLGAPAGQHLAGVLMQAHDGFSANEGLGVGDVVAAAVGQEGLGIPHLSACQKGKEGLTLSGCHNREPIAKKQH